MSISPNEILYDHLKIITEVMKDIKDGLDIIDAFRDDSAMLEDSGELLKTVMQIITLGSYLKDRYDEELMDSLDAYNRKKDN